MSNIPSHAITVTFQYGNNLDGQFYVWENKGKWQWHALGLEGEEATQKQAIDSAREWILFDYHKKTSQGESE